SSKKDLLWNNLYILLKPPYEKYEEEYFLINSSSVVSISSPLYLSAPFFSYKKNELATFLGYLIE
ncbi:TPA: hypothetical protein ACXZJ0_003919, partial [Salmonella enterica]